MKRAFISNVKEMKEFLAGIPDETEFYISGEFYQCLTIDATYYEVTYYEANPATGDKAYIQIV